MPFGEYHTWEFYPLKLYKDELINPYRAVSDFFQRMSLRQCASVMDDWFSAACTPEVSLREGFSNFVWAVESIERMLEAAWLIRQIHTPAEVEAPTKEQIAVRLNEVVMAYSKQRKNTGVWDCFPRHLAADELMQPHRVFYDLFLTKTLPAWRDELTMLFEAAISNYSIYETLGSCNFYQICKDLYKMVEAGFLINLMDYENEKQRACNASAAV